MSLTPSAQASLNSQSDFNLNTKPVTQYQHHKEDTNHHNSKVTQSTRRKIQFHKALIFVLTFIAYALYSGTRQPFGITKSTLNPDHEKDPYAGPGYAPFNDKDWGSTYLGALDTVFLSFYAIGLFITGPLGDRLNLRWFLSIGMIGSGAFCFLFGSASLFSMHSLGWFIVCNIFAGLFQATGWPSTVTLMTRWFGKGNRGTIMGIWNAQSSIGNIIGKCQSQTQTVAKEGSKHVDAKASLTHLSHNVVSCHVMSYIGNIYSLGHFLATSIRMGVSHSMESFRLTC